MTTPDYAGLIERLRSHEERWECAGGGGWETPEVCIQAATALRTLLESKAALERERTNLIETKREQIGRLQKERDEQWKRADTLAQQNAYHKDRAEAAATALAAKDAELAAVKKMYAHEGAKALHELERAEAAEARVAELEKALEPFAAVAGHDIGEDETDSDAYRPMERFNRAPRITVGHLRAARRALEGGE